MTNKLTDWSQQIVDAFVTTWRAMYTDMGAMMLLFAGGIVYSFFYPLPYSHESVQQVPIVIVDQDHSAISRQISRFAQAHPSIHVLEVTSDLHVAQDRIWRNQAAGMLFIPDDVEKKVLSGRIAEVEVAGNGLYFMLNKAALNGLAEVVGTVSAGIEIKRLNANTPSVYQSMEQRQPVNVNPVPLFNVREGYGSYVVPGVTVLIIQQTLWMAICMLFGTWYQKKTFPFVRDGATYVGTLLAFSCVPLLNCFYYFGFVFWWQNYPRGGNFSGMIFLSILFSLTIAAFGMLFGTWFRTRERSTQLLIATSLPILFMAGLTWPDTALPIPLQYVRWLLPSTAGIQGFIALNQLGASLHEIRREVFALSGLLVFSVAMGFWRWQRLKTET